MGQFSEIIGDDASPSAAMNVMTADKGFNFSSLTRSVLSRIVLPIVCWWTMSVVIILSIKSIVSEKRFPYSFALSGITNTSTGILAWLLAVVFRRWSPPMPSVTWDESLKLYLIGTIQGIEIACNNKSLEFLTVSARTMSGSSNVFFMMLTARLWGLERLGCMRLVVAILLMLGGALQGLDHFSGMELSHESSMYLQGIMLQATTMLAASQRWALVQMVTQRSSTGSALAHMSKSKLQLIARTLPITGAVCMLLSFIFEWQEMTADSWLHLDLAVKSLGIAVGIVILTVSELEIVRFASAVSLQILGTLHQIPVALAGVIFFQEEVHFLSALGFVLCIIGGLMYTRVRWVEARRSTSQEEIPSELVQRGLLHA